MSMHVFQDDEQLMICVNEDGPTTHSSRTLVSVMTLDPCEAHYRLPQAIRVVGGKIDRALRGENLVADPTSWELVVTVKAQVKCWPAIRGITIPDIADDQVPMRDDAS
jgi:hypothetical protein